MKKATRRIIDTFPSLEDKVFSYAMLAGEGLESMDQVKQTFLRLAWFFENPDEVHFDLSFLYRNLDNSYLELALELITQYFREDTYLIQDPSFWILKEEENDFLNQSQFADYLTAQGLKYDRAKVKLYYDRKIIPPADLIIAGTKYWNIATVEAFCESEKKRAADAIRRRE